MAGNRGGGEDDEAGALVEEGCAEARARGAEGAWAAGVMATLQGLVNETVRIEPDLEAVAALQPERDALWARIGAAGFLSDEERRRMAGLGEVGRGEVDRGEVGR